MTAVEIDQFFSIFDPKTRQALRDTVKGSAELLRGRGHEINRSVTYLNPALSTGTRLFRELSRDEPLLERFLIDFGRRRRAPFVPGPTGGDREGNSPARPRALGASFGFPGVPRGHPVHADQRKGRGCSSA